jgi:hypothetical protein
MDTADCEQSELSASIDTNNSASTIPKPTGHPFQHDPRKLLAAEITEKDVKAAAASALAAAAVKAKVFLVERCSTLLFSVS